ncbi:MAG: 30S ribosomal protein S12 methylthiotransferase RimO [Prevotella sp.]|nr:30S ribosomal protein S12 methylthiotransferase RimO [Prevotella sp.]
MKKGQVDIITMGCSKNLVDSELLKRQFEANGFVCKHDALRPQGEIVVINTCGFIADAKEESINEILKFAQAKDKGKIQRLYVMGCLSQRYREELEKNIPQVDRYFGKFDYMNLLEELGRKEVATCIGKRSITTPKHYAYLKISEGCDRRCAYCAIPVMTGRHKSRPKAEILAEVRDLVAQGVKEFQVIAQELTYYGVDLSGQRELADLIREIAEIDGVEWIRLHYAYPTQFPMDLLDVMRENPKVCKYLDVALQHIADPVLKRMHRNVTKAETMDFIRKIRAAVPGICLRTTLMVGFPDETDEDFAELLEFVRWARFERMGAFAYSEEEDTYSGKHYKDDVPQSVKDERLSRLMALQQEISEEMQAEMVGKTIKVIIDRREGDYYIGRSEFSSPEVDPEVLIPASERRLQRGRFYQVKITDSDEFDLYGIVE